MKKLIVFLFCLPSIFSFSQKASTWKGGCPGHAFDWNWPANWSTNSRPDEFTDVNISFDNSCSINYPVIIARDVVINSLFIAQGAYVVLENSRIIVIDKNKSYYKENQLRVKEAQVKWKENITEGSSNISGQRM